ncbi:hypothetical protein [Paraburkholderia sp. SIMBA_053]|uniref:hypothetical protein n=1 Tax=Paraburkholderia sp. SIMBA_053 TaxID=3085794 RepID=UPI00397DEDF0
MSTESSTTLRFLALVARHADSPIQLIEQISASRSETEGAEAQMVSAVPTILDKGRLAVQAAENGRSLTDEQLSNVEALIDSEFRPAIDIVDDTFAVTHPLWRRLSDDPDVRGRIEAAASSVGRVELPGNPQYP